MIFTKKIAYSLVILIFSMPLLAQTKVLDIQHWTTKKGTPVYFVQTKQVPILVLQIAFDGGSARDGSLPGTSALLNSMLNEGNAGLTATQMAEGFENIGAEYNHWINRDMTVFQLKTITEENKLNSALDYFAKIFQPDFPIKAFEREKKLQKIAISQEQESPDAVAQKALLKIIYPHHPYGNSMLGTADSVVKIELKDVKAFHQKYYVSHNAVISMAGAIDLNTAKKIAEKIMEPIAEGEKAEALPKVIQKSRPLQKNIPYSSAQTAIRLGQVGITHKDPDYFPLMVGNYSLGGGMLVSRLSDEIREKRGLAYNVRSGFDPLSAGGPFVISLATRTEKAPEALDITKKTLKKFVEQGSTLAELNAAKRFIQGNFPLRFETNTAIASSLLNMGFYQLPLDYLDTYLWHVNSVTIKQIKAAFQKHIQPEEIMTVTVGKMPKH